MEGYSAPLMENYASARLEGVDASYKDLTQVCGRITNKDAAWAINFLLRASKAEIPILYKRHNKRLGHRKELGGKKGRYPKKSAKIVMKVLQSAVANGIVRGLGESYTIMTATANKKFIYPRMASKGRRARAYYELARVEIIIRPRDEIPSGVEVTPAKSRIMASSEPKKELKSLTATEEARKNEAQTRTPGHPETGEHKHEHEKEKAAAHAIHERMSFEHGKGKKMIVKNDMLR